MNPSSAELLAIKESHALATVRFVSVEELEYMLSLSTPRIGTDTISKAP